MQLIGNKCIEKDIRDWLSIHGYYGNSAKVLELELHAIERPGWLQVFRFTIEAKTKTGKWETLFGSARDDERYKDLTIKAFSNRQRQQQLLSTWSEGLISRQSSRSDEITSLPMLGLFVFSFFGAVVGLLYLISKFTG